jgi:hypothetical protein
MSATPSAGRPITDRRTFKVMRAVVGATNPFVRRLLDSRFAGPLARALMLLRFRGRSSGRWFTTPVGYVREGETIVVVTSPAYRWWRNVVGGADVRVRLPDGWRDGHARVLAPDDEQFDETVAMQVRGRGPRMLRGFGVDVDDEGRIAPDARAGMSEKAHIVRIDLAPER